MNKLEAFGHIAALAIRGELVFPTSVNAALRVQLALDDPDCPMEQAISLVLAEPLLAARTVAIANSAMFNRSGSAPITNVRNAITRIGYHNLFALAAAMVVRQFGSKITHPDVRAKAEQLWDHTIHVAALARIIARQVTGVNPDTALFAAIVHEVGGFYLLSRADEMPGLLDDPSDWMGAAQEIIAREMMKKLAIPDPVALPIVSLRGATLTPPPLGLRDTLLIAKHLAPVPSPLASLDREGGAGLARFIDGNVDLEQILAESAHDAASMSAALLV